MRKIIYCGILFFIWGCENVGVPGCNNGSANKLGQTSTTPSTPDPTNPPTAPSITLKDATDSNSYYTDSTSINVTLSTCTDISAVLITETSTQPAAGAITTACSTAANNYNYTFTNDTDGVKTVYVWAKNAVGVSTSSGSSSIVLANDCIGATSCTWGATSGTSTDSVLKPVFVASSPSGNAVATWTSTTNVYATRYTGGTWDTPIVVNSNGGTPYYNTAYLLRAAINDNGNTIVTWLDSNTSQTALLGKKHNGSSWDAGVTEISSSTDTAVKSIPRVGMDNAGRIMATWLRTEAVNNSLYYNFFNGSSWTGQTNHSSAPDGVSYADLAATPNGKFYSIWSRFDGSTYKSIMDSFNGSAASPTWTGSQTLSDIACNGLINTRVAIAANVKGFATAAWWQSTSPTELCLADYDSTTWRVTSYTSPTLGKSNDIKIAISTVGAYSTVVWQEKNVSNIWELRTSMFNGSTWSASEAVSDTSQNITSNNFNVAMDISQDAIATWVLANKIYTSRYNGSSWTSQETSLTNGNVAAIPFISMAANGKAFLVWRQSDATNYFQFRPYQ